jgi:MinD-like ATPase involved in chromosome partitioning or flagellar assembly
MSSIITFYSYKGGVGRSMALSNIAVLLARRGLKVLAVDWDLEARGLEPYFSYFVTSETGSGLLRMLMQARDNGSANFTGFTSSIDCGAQHPISLLASGREQDDAYSLNLGAFDWGEFFAKGGGAFLERLREEWRGTFDIVLIDSRTGLSDTGGICTIQLPDAVVAMFTANHQSLYGVRDVMRLAQKARQSLAYDRMPLSVLPLPSRWGVQEFQETQVWLNRVVDGMQEFYADWLPRSLSPRQIVESIKIPHHSYFGFGERLAVVEQGTTDPTGLGFVYDKVAAFLASDFKDLTPLIGEGALLAAASAGAGEGAEGFSEDSSKYDVFVSYDHWSAEAVLEFVEALTAALTSSRGEQARIFVDKSEIDVARVLTSEHHDALSRSKVMLALLTPRYFASKFAVAEFDWFLERRNRKLLLAVILSGDPRKLPDFIRELRSLDMRDASILAMSKMGPSRRPAEWYREIQTIADVLNAMIQDASLLDPPPAPFRTSSGR